MNKKLIFVVFSILLISGVNSAASGSTLRIENGTSIGNDAITVNITALNVLDLSNFDITLSYDPSVVNVTNANNNPAFNDPAFPTPLNNLEKASNGTIRLMTYNTGSGQSGDVLLSTLTLRAVGDPGQKSYLNLTVNTFVNSVEADIPVEVAIPIVSDPTVNHEIPDDTDNEPMWGETAQLNVTVIDDSGVASVTVNLSEIGGLSARPMTNIGGNIWSTTTNASAGTSPKIYNLTVNATNIFGNSNNSVVIPLRVMKNGDCSGNGAVNSGDATRIYMNTSYPNNPLYPLSSPYVCDVTGNGAINSGDATRIYMNTSYPANLLYPLK